MKAVWAWIAAGFLLVAVLFGVSQYDWRDQSPSADATGERYQQQSGASQAGRQDTTVGKSENQRAEEVTGTAGPLQLNETQRAKLHQQLAGRSDARVDTADFSISVGASVPRQVQLRDLPVEVADTLGGYHGSQYLIVRDQMVIVDESRRIVAVVPGIA